MSDTMDEEQEQVFEEELFTCSLCYFIGTQAEFQNHKTCELHGFNYRLKIFTENRSKIVKDRRGVKITSTCRGREVEHNDKYGTNTITLFEEEGRETCDVELRYEIANEQRNKTVYLRNVLQLHPNAYFELSHKYAARLAESEDNLIEIQSKKCYAIKLRFSGPLYLSTYRMPLAFVLQIDDEVCFTLLREMVVNIEKQCAGSDAEDESSKRDIYTGRPWTGPVHVIPANVENDPIGEFAVPTEYRAALLAFMKLEDGQLTRDDVTSLKSIQNIFGKDGPGLTRDNYKFYISMLLWMEELKEDKEIRKYNMEGVRLSVTRNPMKAEVTLEVPGLAEKRPSLVAGDRVQMRLHIEETSNDGRHRYTSSGPRVVYEGVISKVLDREVEIDDFNEEFLDEIEHGDGLVDVRFIMTRLRYERMHRALSCVEDYMDRLFPRDTRDHDSRHYNGDAYPPITRQNGVDARQQDGDVDALRQQDGGGRYAAAVNGGRSSGTRTDSQQRRPTPAPDNGQWITDLEFSNKLVARNAEQSLAVENILNRSSGTAPYILFGPPGTGKTVTIVEAIVQIIKNLPHSKILVCAPANMACDMLTCKLREYFTKSELIRVHSPHRDFTIVPEEIYPYSNLTYDEPDTRVTGALAMKADELNARDYRIVVCTLMHAGKYAKSVQQSNATLKFTHLVVDEAAQSLEPETLIPMAGLLDPARGQLILAGDPKQLGPICQSLQVKHLGLGISLMERLMTANPLYESTAGYRDIRYITKLVKNFRSHADIIRTPNKFFYENELQCCSREACSDPIAQADIMEELAFGGEAIEFYGVAANECRQGRSPSYYNTMEKDVVIQYIVKLLLEFGDEQRIKPPVKASDIGVISPYIKQVYKIKNELQDLGGQYRDVEVGSTEAFQGREKRIMIISTVRGSSQLLDYDKRYNLGFLVDEKRFNVALTRAKSKLIIVGNPLCLTYNQYWQDYMEECNRLGRYLGYKYMKRDLKLMDFITKKMKRVMFQEKPVF